MISLEEGGVVGSMTLFSHHMDGQDPHASATADHAHTFNDIH